MTATAVARPTGTRTPDGPRRRRPTDWTSIGLWVSLVITCLIWAIPFIFMFLTAVKTQADVSTRPVWALPELWAWGNFAEGAQTGDLWNTGLNSLLVSVIKVPLGLLLAAAAAYVLGTIRFRRHKLVVAIFAVGSMVPIQIALGPLFNTMLSLGLLDSLPGLILPYLAFGIPYQIFMLYGFFRAIPEEMIESARVEGASTFRIFWQICLPMAKPALAALFILDFVATWNEYAIAVTLLQSQANYTIPLAVQNFSTQFSTDYGQLNAFIFMSAIPVLIVYLMFQRYFVQGAFAGSVKG
ncbi:carbohydrate ABC transporter permease [Ruania alkalisoli]|uniref:Carbohydrate ABC transporter permease n=1 Tax=Ruania alkalisoli TaxID=2779775 RepID=A0A7M1STE5_9MICO|nr:carbohydrate ABC transporter permease [Ruania alkalisoli]QOR70397.1 carbohydrate ABC transporter permease [Ruania alkalisoli]